ncbi:hypothetical protein EDB80DRAFT_872823 [Ilyonectria destructans]|nr:hypothetical protein EDB80DRAFT_872823 [Ilyonectria destructans]
MLLSFPPELIRMITRSCPLRTRALLASTCRRLYEICNPTLYRSDVQNHGSSSVFHAIARCTDEFVALRTLKAAANGGADFKQCQDFYGTRSFLHEPSQIAVHSPLCLAAGRGLDSIVRFLVDHGISPDGPGGTVVPPLFQAITNRREVTAAWLVSRGASLTWPRFPQNALQAAILNSLPSLTIYLAKWTDLDINQRTVAGSPSIVLALRSRQTLMVPLVIGLGADVKEPLWQLCREHEWRHVVGILETGSVRLAQALQTHGCLEFVLFVAMRKARSCDKGMQIVALDRIMTLQTMLEVDSRGSRESLPKEVTDMLQGLLQRMLSIDRGDLEIASVLVRHGVKLQSGIYIDLAVVHQHPKVLKSFDFVFSHCSSMSMESRDATMDYFLSQVPTQAIELLQRMKDQKLPLTAHGLGRMENRPSETSQSE